MYSITFFCRISIKGTRENVSTHKVIYKQRKNIVPLHETHGLKISDPNIFDFIKQENVVDRRIPAENKNETEHSSLPPSRGTALRGQESSTAVIQCLLDFYG